MWLCAEGKDAGGTGDLEAGESGDPFDGEMDPIDWTVSGQR